MAYDLTRTWNAEEEVTHTISERKKKMLVFLHKKNLVNNIHTYVLRKNIYVGKAKFKGMRKD